MDLVEGFMQRKKGKEGEINHEGGGGDIGCVFQQISATQKLKKILVLRPQICRHQHQMLGLNILYGKCMNLFL